MSNEPDPAPGDGEWFEARKRPVTVEARGPYTDPSVVETLEGDFEVDQDYIDGHDGYYIVRGVEGEVYPCAADIFEQTYDTNDEALDNPVVMASDGPRLILANGKVVAPQVSFRDGGRLFSLGYDQGAAMYGPEVDDRRVDIAFVDDPDAHEIQAVADRLTAYGFAGGGGGE